jgi:periplasmic protein TonB
MIKILSAYDFDHSGACLIKRNLLHNRLIHVEDTTTPHYTSKFWSMEPKKTKRADLTEKSFLFFNIGLVVSLGLAIMAFNYRVYDSDKAKTLTGQQGQIEEMIEPPVTEQLPPPPQFQIEQPQIVEVPNDKKIEQDIKINMDIETHLDKVVIEAPIIQPVIEEEKEDPHQIFIVVEETAVPIGGLPAFYEYVLAKMKYPAQARRMEIEGKVFVEFVVEKDGAITDVKAIKGIGAGCDEEAVRVVSESPRWKPAKQRGRAVRQRMVLPITFRMNK